MAEETYNKCFDCTECTGVHNYCLIIDYETMKTDGDTSNEFKLTKYDEAEYMMSDPDNCGGYETKVKCVCNNWSSESEWNDAMAKYSPYPNVV